MTKTSAADLITPAQAADLIGVSTATLRRYSTQFKKHLSKYARAKRRQYTQRDLATLVGRRVAARFDSAGQIITFKPIKKKDRNHGHS